MKKLIINLAPTGVIPMKADTPHVPITPEEIISDVETCIPLGISMVHLHVRENDGTPTYNKNIYRPKAIKNINSITLGFRKYDNKGYTSKIIE